MWREQRETYFWKLLLLKGSSFHLKIKKISFMGTLSGDEITGNQHTKLFTLWSHWVKHIIWSTTYLEERCDEIHCVPAKSPSLSESVGYGYRMNLLISHRVMVFKDWLTLT